MKNLRVACVVLLAAVVLGSAAGCQQVLYAPQYQTGTITHFVVCYLKNKGNEAERKRLLDARWELRKIKGVYDVECGPVLPNPNRPDVVVSDFDVAFLVIFRDAESYRNYEKDPAHVKMVEEVLKPLTSKVVVYDITNQE
jgi:hypothetical protein